jgi:hypothetical protein
MIKIVNPLVRSLSPQHNELSWEIENTTQDPWDYTFQIFRSEGQEGQWDQLTGTFTDRYYYIDTRIPKYRMSRHLFYKIEIVKRSDSSSSESEVFSREGPTNKYAAAIARQERLLFKKFMGQRVLILPIKTFGFECGCYDKVAGKRLKADCLQCYGTGFVGGYMNAIETYAQVNAEPYKIVPAQGAETEPRANNIIATNYPLIKPYDLIVQPDLNYRWRVAVVAPTRLGGALVHQNLTVSGIARADKEFGIEIDETVLQDSRPDTLSKLRTTI